jgi:hypothetical protein
VTPLDGPSYAQGWDEGAAAERAAIVANLRALNAHVTALYIETGEI